MDRFEVNCIEQGKYFYFVMETDETDKDKIMTEARNDARGIHNAEVISIDWNGTKEEV